MELLIELGKVIFVVAVAGIIAVVLRYVSLKPSDRRTWVNDNKKAAFVDFRGDEFILHNVRDFTWRTGRDYDEFWTDMTFRLDQVTRLWLTLEYFAPANKLMAHTVLSFEFEDGRRIACSIEVRRVHGRQYGPVKGLFRHFELAYVWSTESDVIGVRSRCRKRSENHLFEVNVLGAGNERRMLESYLKRTNKLYEEPEWYHTVTNTCTTNIVRHVNDIYPGRIPWGIAVIMPGISPKLLCKKRIIKFNGTVTEALASSKIDDLAKAWDGESDFGDWIRRIGPKTDLSAGDGSPSGT